MPFRLLTIIPIACLILTFVGCGDDDCPQCPPVVEPGEIEPSYANIWPSADGNVWIFDLDLRGYEGDPADVLGPEDPIPDLPSMESLYALLGESISHTPMGASLGLYRMSFDGEVTTHSGVTAQRLREELFTPPATKRLIAPQPQRLREHILAQRPDLRDPADGNDTRRPPTDKAVGDELAPPFLMGGYAFEATDHGLYGYGDLNTEQSWIYLEGDLSVGQEFSIQLVPDLADDVWLYGRIWSQQDRVLDGHTYENCVECFYVMDLGVAEAVNEEGEFLGRMRSYEYGSVYYAPGVGTVFCHQRSYFLGGGMLAAVPVILEYDAVIAGTEIGP